MASVDLLYGNKKPSLIYSHYKKPEKWEFAVAIDGAAIFKELAEIRDIFKL